MEHEILRKEYVFKLKTKKKYLNTILKNLIDKKWHRLTVKHLNFVNKNEKSKLENNKIVFDTFHLQRVILDCSFLLNIKDFNKIIYDEKIINILKNYFGKEPFLKKIDIFHSENYDEDNNVMKKQKWHVDEPLLQIKENKKFIKLFIPLCDVNKINGATKIVKGSREKLPKSMNFADLSQKRFEDDFINNHYNKEDIISLNSSYGEIFLARTDGFHKGGFVKKGFRTIIIVEYNC